MKLNFVNCKYGVGVGVDACQMSWYLGTHLGHEAPVNCVLYLRGDDVCPPMPCGGELSDHHVRDRTKHEGGGAGGGVGCGGVR